MDKYLRSLLAWQSTVMISFSALGSAHFVHSHVEYLHQQLRHHEELWADQTWCKLHKLETIVAAVQTGRDEDLEWNWANKTDTLQTIICRHHKEGRRLWLLQIMLVSVVQDISLHNSPQLLFRKKTSCWCRQQRDTCWSQSGCAVSPLCCCLHTNFDWGRQCTIGDRLSTIRHLCWDPRNQH